MSAPKAELKTWPMKGPSLRELFVGELRDLHDVENRLIKALPKLAKRANSCELCSGLKLIWHKRTSLPNASSKLWCHWARSHLERLERNVQRGSSRKAANSWVKRLRQLLWTPPCLSPRKGRSTMKLPPMVAFEIGPKTAQDDDAELLAKTLK